MPSRAEARQERNAHVRQSLQRRHRHGGAQIYARSMSRLCSSSSSLVLASSNALTAAISLKQDFQCTYTAQPRRLLSSPGPGGVRLRASRRERTQRIQYSGGVTYEAKRGKDPTGALLDLPLAAVLRSPSQPPDKFTMTILPHRSLHPRRHTRTQTPCTRHGSRIFILNPRMTGKPLFFAFPIPPSLSSIAEPWLLPTIHPCTLKTTPNMSSGQAPALPPPSMRAIAQKTTI